MTTLERLIGAAGYDLALQPRPSFAVAGEHRGAPVLVPNQLPALPPAQALARIELPLHLEWSSGNRTKDLAVRDERIRVYELALREGTPDDVLRYVDPTLLLDAFEELNLPAAIRAAWQPALARWRGRCSTRSTSRSRASSSRCPSRRGAPSSGGVAALAHDIVHRATDGPDLFTDRRRVHTRIDVSEPCPNLGHAVTAHEPRSRVLTGQR